MGPIDRIRPCDRGQAREGRDMFDLAIRNRGYRAGSKAEPCRGAAGTFLRLRARATFRASATIPRKRWCNILGDIGHTRKYGAPSPMASCTDALSPELESTMMGRSGF